MALTTEFEGIALPSGWTFVQNAASNASLVVADGFATVTNPVGQQADSISSTSSPDNTAGLEHAISGDFDIAVRVASIVSGQNSGMIGFILRGASTAETIRWTIYGNSTQGYKYGYARSSGAGAAYQAAQILRLFGGINWHWGHPAWMRAKRVGSVYTFYLSGDGVNWYQESTVTSGVNATTFKLSTGQYADALGEPVRWDAVVDLLAAGTTDARKPAPTLVESSTETTDFTTLPAWLSTSSAVGGSAVHSSGKVALSTANADQSYGRLTYNGTPKANAGMLCRVSIPAPRPSAYAAIGLGVVDGGPNIDQYSAGPIYGIELKLDASGTTLPIRVHRPINYVYAANSFDESYTFLSPSFPSDDALVWWRMHRYGNRFQIRWWLDGNAEPSTWSFDGEDDTLNGEGDLVPYFAVSHNDGSATDGTVEVHDLSFYELLPASAGTPGAPNAITDLAGIAGAELVTLTWSEPIGVQ